MEEFDQHLLIEEILVQIFHWLTKDQACQYCRISEEEFDQAYQSGYFLKARHGEGERYEKASLDSYLRGEGRKRNPDLN